MRRLDPDRAARAVGAFLNTEGGTLYVGVEEDGSVAGLESLDEAATRLRQVLDEKLSPPYPVAVRVEEEEEKRYVVAEVPPGPEPPYAVGEQFLVRKGTQTTAGSNEELKKLLANRKERSQRWERQPALGVSLDDLSTDEIRRTATEAGENRLSQLSELDSPEAVLDALHLLDGGEPTNAAAILFAKDPSRSYPQTRVRAVRFADDDATESIDNRVFEGHAFHLAEAIQGFFRKHLRIGSRIEEGAFKRTDTPEYPPYVLREGLMNALVHRDYSAYNGGLTVFIYPHRVEFWNPGRLPEGLRPQRLKDARVSRPHNPDIAHVFFLRGLIERWGTGTRRIFEECKARRLPEPRWEEVGGGIRLTLYLRHAESGVLEEVNDRMMALLQEASPGDTFTSPEYAERYAKDVSDRSARKDLRQLVEMGFLRKEGHGPTTRYHRTEDPLPDE